MHFHKLIIHCTKKRLLRIWCHFTSKYSSNKKKKFFNLCYL